MRAPLTHLRPVLAALCFLALSGCLTVPRDAPDKAFVVNAAASATVPEFPKARFNADDPTLAGRLEADMRETAKKYPKTRPYQILALSGGGADGAFGAGVLIGWTKRGDRPEFDIVTGVSTGALIAPLAFLGPDYDGKLREAYTSGVAAGLTHKRGLYAAFTPGIFQAGELRGLVARYVDDALLLAIAREQLKGRRLFVATTNLDSQEGVVWDIGAIALEAQTHPYKQAAALDLVRKILVASASIPGAFAPVMIETNSADNVNQTNTDSPRHPIQEMHIDGSVTLPFFILPESMLDWTVPADLRRGGHVYVLVNGKINPAYSVTKNNAVTIAARSLETIIKAQARVTLVALRAFAERNGLDVAVTAMPDAFSDGGMMAFDTQSMNKVFNLGYGVGLSKDNWTDKKP
ncbi:MAG: patatin-like phospholipase family protein [Asticcacaulis sp.]